MISVDEQFIPINKRFSNKYFLVDALKELGNPEKEIPTINIVGTNGKGSTSFYLSKGLLNKYKKVGLFISPAFIYQNERIQINNEYISDEDLKKYLAKIQNLITKYNLTFFEIWTLIAILYFKDNGVDIAVMEAGIGGIKDATNLMSNQIATLVTAIDFDHTEILGNKIEEIIYQKVRIAKPNTKIYISSDNKKYQEIIDKTLKDIDVEIIYTNKIDDDVKYQQGNKSLVNGYLKSIGINSTDYLMEKAPLGRFTILRNNPLFIIDGAHNESGIDNLIETYNNLYKRKDGLVLVGSSYNKDYIKNISKLENNFGKENIFITNFDHFKSWDIKDVNIGNKINDWKAFLNDNINKNIIVCGSLYFIPQVYEWFINKK